MRFFTRVFRRATVIPIADLFGPVVNSAETGEQLAARALEGNPRLARPVRLDFARVEVLTSSSVGALLGRLAEIDPDVLEESPKSVEFVNCTPPVRAALDLVRGGPRARSTMARSRATV